MGQDRRLNAARPPRVAVHRLGRLQPRPVHARRAPPTGDRVRIVARRRLPTPVAAFAAAFFAATLMMLAGPARAQAYEGSVVKVDKAQGKLTLQHGEIKALGLPAMTMRWHVADPSWLDALAEGVRVRFDADKVGGNFTVTRLTPQR